LEDLTLIGVVDLIRPVTASYDAFRLSEYFEEVIARSEVYKDLDSWDYDA
jgi:hypothetical protein